MSRWMIWMLLSLMLVAAGAAMAQPQLQVDPQLRVTDLRLAPNALLLALSQEQRLAEYKRLLAIRRLTEARRSALAAQFSRYPADLQDALLVARSDNLARTAGVPSATVYKLNPLWRVNPELFKVKPKINTIWPYEGGYRDQWCFAMGAGFTDNCKIVFDGVELATNHMSDWDDFFPGALAFKPPSGATLGTAHQVVARNKSTSADSDAFSYKIVAQRGYRGYYGWQFANFSNAAIGWHLYRDFFGAAAVEYSNGTHRPAAQAWYDSAYKGVGNGGNCYGMSVSSLKLSRDALNTYHKAWFADPANHKAFAWWYPWGTNTRETVQEDQGGQLSLELATYINTYYNNQTHQQLWTRASGSMYPARPVLGMWSGSGGHAIVPYSEGIAGTDHYLNCYDNNVPYTETESGGPHKSVTHVNWTTGSFSYGSYTKAVCLTYAECTVAPHLPSAATGTMGNLGATQSRLGETAVCVVSGGTKVAQVTDENGRQLLNPDGTGNESPNTRIPLAMRFLPLTGNPALPTDPFIAFFSNAGGKTLNVSLAGSGERTLSFFTPGSALIAQGTGPGELNLLNVAAPTRQLRIANAAAFGVSRLDYISSAPAGDRRFRLSEVRGTTAQALTIGLNRDGSALEVQSGGPVQFNLEVLAPIRGASQRAAFGAVAVQAGQRALLQPTAWTDLTRGLNLQLRTLQGNRLQNNRLLRPSGQMPPPSP